MCWLLLLEFSAFVFLPIYCRNSKQPMSKSRNKRTKPSCWSWLGLSHIADLKEVLRRPNLPWERMGLSYNKDISLEFIDAFDRITIGDRGAEEGSDRITKEFGERSDRAEWVKQLGERSKDSYALMTYPPGGRWYWAEITKRIDINIIIEQRLRRPWDFSKVGQNPTVTYEFLRTVWSDSTSIPLFARHLPIKIVEDHLDLAWNRCLLSSNPGMTVDLIDKIDRYAEDNPNANIHDEWRWNNLSEYMAPDEIAKAPRRPWIRQWISRNDRITIAFVLKYYGPRKLPKTKGRWYWPGILSRASDINEYDLATLPHRMRRPWISLSWNPWLRDPTIRRLTKQQRGNLVDEELAAKLPRSLLFRYWDDWHPNMYDPGFLTDDRHCYGDNKLTIRDAAQIDPVFRRLYYDIAGVVLCPQFADIIVMTSVSLGE